MEELGRRIALARANQGYSVQSASRAAGISRDTWKKIEAGKPSQDAKRQAALKLLRLDQEGLDLAVGALLQTPGQFVGSTGERVDEGRRSDGEVLRAIASMSARFDQLDAGQRDLSAGVAALGEHTDARFEAVEAAQRELSERLAQLEEPRT